MFLPQTNSILNPLLHAITYRHPHLTPSSPSPVEKKVTDVTPVYNSIEKGEEIETFTNNQKKTNKIFPYSFRPIRIPEQTFTYALKRLLLQLSTVTAN